ncbi:UDP-N-acetylmuramoyl-L-alanyl-D-glutamate--2,6-diaminopimelate ligase [Noviherbaspirillum galbum]|uniref:UDP-N-acetylmuramoyl-L-alanyl-D-glutamate--2,6-diaminopimelate ligase n=1 Tax=Noviherbaspirillum galbum TaxID=2709383 RepID=A0A6B3SU38_9BURK|nr:UDP-N-acetylmuramoyl-L-alanyl-D-glutamate--2,6-diaminopimelate ligase [Noviherbaspirillum galbum]NEX64510.1 UDP-N-acetylmuramoyl-L-alanyl-D-glutamate--2,6-diaminopimelate ligase [Noviherbaspirillum galbum]
MAEPADTSSLPGAVTGVTDWLRAHAPQAGLSSDSRAIRPGDVFFAFPGDAADGRRFIENAIEAGAKAVVFDEDGFDWRAEWPLPHLAVSGLKALSGPVANAWYGRPDAAMFSVAVTGTNGKTSCSQWVAKAISQLGENAAVIGTLGTALYRKGAHAGFSETGYTTPDAIVLQRRLAGLRDAGARAVAIEASSIGIAQGRMDGMHVDVAVFTNLTRDHLDYHGDMAAYEAAKRRLFDWPGLQAAVVNLDDDAGMRLVKYIQSTHPQVRLIGYTLQERQLEGGKLLRAADIRSAQGGTSFRIEGNFGSGQVKTKLVGNFNVSNVLAVLGALMAKGADFKSAIDALESLAAVPGRMQQLGGQEAPLIVIDYAHTPDALEKTLSTLREVAKQRAGELWCLFGCGGDRDPGKRPQMGKASELADRIVATSDNPRSEEPAVILEQIVQGIAVEKRGAEVLQVIEDRATAILWAVRHAAKNDVVLLAGKGHEPYQEIKGKKLPFLDADHAALALAARATMKGTY